MTVAVAIAAIVSVFALFLAFLYLLARHALEEGPPMTGPSSTPRGERAGTPGAHWNTQLARTEQVVDDNAPDPAPPDRATRRALARAARRKK